MIDKCMKMFLFDDVFIRKRGRRLIEDDQIDGNIAYISSTKSNGGISAFINPPDFMIRYRNMLTISNSGSVGYCFYHNYDFVASDHVTVISIKDPCVLLSKNIAIYLKPIFESIKYKYNFGREISDTRLAKEKILLPVDSKGIPDWYYMEHYIESLKLHIEWKPISHKKSSMLLHIEDWNNFSMDSLFKFKKGKRLTKENMLPGKTRFIGAISKDNGIRQFIEEDELHKGGCITVNYNGSVGEAFYQAEGFWASDDVNVLYPKEWTLNKYNAMFIISIIKANKYLFSYGRKWTTEKMKKTLLILPVQTDGTPDWDYMERYIKSLPYSDRI